MKAKNKDHGCVYKAALIAILDLWADIYRSDKPIRLAEEMAGIACDVLHENQKKKR